MREKFFEHILKVEGEAYTNHPNDRGKGTKFGVTQALLDRYLEIKDAPPMDVRFLSKPLARDIYFEMKWKPAMLDHVQNDTYATIFFDQYINQRPHVVIKRLQRSLNRCVRGARLKVDGIMGPKTIGTFNKCGKRTMVDFIQSSQLFYIAITRQSPSQLVFLTGWIRRTQKLWDILDFGL